MAEKKNNGVNPEIAEARGAGVMPGADEASEERANTMLDANDNAGNETIPQSPVGDSSPDKESQEINGTNGDSSPDKGKLEKKEDLVEHIFPSIPGGSEYFECSINCVRYKFLKGIPVKIPRCVYELYVSSNRDTVAANTAKSRMPRNV